MVRWLTLVPVFICMFAVACSGGGTGEDRAAQPGALDLAEKMAATAGA